MDEVLVGSVESPIVPEPQDNPPEIEVEAEKMAIVGQDPNWQVIQDYMSERIDHYKNNLAGFDIKGMTLVEVGEKYLVCSLVAMEFEALMNKVNVTTEAVNESRKRA